MPHLNVEVSLILVEPAVSADLTRMTVENDAKLTFM